MSRSISSNRPSYYEDADATDANFSNDGAGQLNNNDVDIKKGNL